MSRRIPLYPAILSVIPVAFLFSQNMDKLGGCWEDALKAAFLIASLTFIIVVALAANLRDGDKAAAIVAWCLLLFFSYGHIFNLAGFLVFRWRNVLIGPNKILFPIWALFFCLGPVLIARSHRSVKRIGYLLGVFSVALISISLCNSIFYNLHGGRPCRWFTGNFGSVVEAGADETRPDIYYIILDGYAATDILKDYYDYDNGRFIGFLMDKGFRVTSASHSNYAHTELSLASSLNMNYLFPSSYGAGGVRHDGRMTHSLIEDNRTVSFLKKNGYKYLHVCSGWAVTDHSRHADLSIEYRGLNEFRMTLLKTTMLMPFLESLYGQRVIYNFRRIPNAVREFGGAKFVFAHIVMPHPPYVFGPHGEFLSRARTEFADYNVDQQKQMYLDQLTYINREVERLVCSILGNSRRPPIIIIQSDHGAAFHVDKREWSSPTKELIRERMSILNAYYLPDDGTAAGLYDTISPVNTFRYIFNRYFGAEYMPLPDRSYFSSYENIYDVTEVTKLLK